MNLKDIGELNTERFLSEAFDATRRNKLVRAARFRRNVYLILFIVGFLCIFVAGFSGLLSLSVLSLGLSTLSLVVMTKYDTQLFFLKMIAKKEETSEA